MSSLAGVAAVENAVLGHETMTEIVNVKNAHGTGHAVASVSTAIAVVSAIATMSPTVIVTATGTVTATESIVVVISSPDVTTVQVKSSEVVTTGGLFM